MKTLEEKVNKKISDTAKALLEMKLPSIATKEKFVGEKLTGCIGGKATIVQDLYDSLKAAIPEMIGHTKMNCTGDCRRCLAEKKAFAALDAALKAVR